MPIQLPPTATVHLDGHIMRSLNPRDSACKMYIQHRNVDVSSAENLGVTRVVSRLIRDFANRLGELGWVSKLTSTK